MTIANDQILGHVVLADLSISVWTARKFDRGATKRANEEAGADSHAGRFNKHLFAGAETHRRIGKIAAAARNTHYQETLPWADKGARLLPTKNYLEYVEKLRSFEEDFNQAVQEFLDSYEDLCQEARFLLGELYNPDDYPSVAAVRAKFQWNLDFEPLPTTGDIRVELPAQEIEAMRQSLERRINSSIQEASKDAWARLHKVVANIRERLSDPDKIFRDSLIGNVEDVVDLLTRLNVTGDPELEKMRRLVETELSTVAPEDLRKDEEYRNQTADKANEILNQMAAFYAPQEAN